MTLLWLVAVLALAAPASAHGSHHGTQASHRVTTSIAHQQRRATLDEPAAQPDSQGPNGRDKCRKTKAGRGMPPWCTDPSWIYSTTLRAETRDDVKVPPTR